MKMLDFHTHIYPDHIAQKATQSISQFYDLPTRLVGTAETLLDRLQAGGISGAVLLPVAIRAEQVHHINQFVGASVAAHSEFWGFGTLHVDMEDPFKEITYIQSLGLKGIKLHPDTQQFAIDDPRMFPIYDALQGQLPVLVHCGDPRYDFSHPTRLKRVLQAFPKLQIIAAHMGGWSMFDLAFSLLEEESCYLDLSSSLMFMGPEKMKELIAGYGADRILFGSDFPLWDPKQEAEAFLQLGLGAEVSEKIAWHNAMKILGEKGKEPGRK